MVPRLDLVFVSHHRVWNINNVTQAKLNSIIMETFSLFFVCGGPLLWKTLQHNLCIGSIWIVFWENLQQSIHCISIYLLFQIICFKLYRLIRQSCLLALFWKLSREMEERKKQSLKTNFPDSSSASLMKKYLTLFEDGDFQIEFWPPHCLLLRQSL